MQDAFAYIAAVTFSACTAILSISEANIMKSLFDSFTKSNHRKNPQGTGAASGGDDDDSASTSLRTAVLKLFVVVIGEAVCATLASSCLANATNSLKQKLREYLLDKLLQQVCLLVGWLGGAMMVIVCTACFGKHERFLWR